MINSSAVEGKTVSLKGQCPDADFEDVKLNNKIYLLFNLL